MFSSSIVTVAIVLFKEISFRSGMRKKGVNVYFKIDRFTHQRVMLGVTTVTGDIRDAVEFIQDPNTRFKFDNLVKVQFVLDIYNKFD